MRIFNIKETFVDKYDPWPGILLGAEFTTRSTENRLKAYSQGQLSFGCDMTLVIKHKVYWEIICQLNQTQVNKDNICKNSNRVD